MAIKLTFTNHGTEIAPAPIGLSQVFGKGPVKQMQGAHFQCGQMHRRAGSLLAVVEELHKFSRCFLHNSKEESGEDRCRLFQVLIEGRNRVGDPRPTGVLSREEGHDG